MKSAVKEKGKVDLFGERYRARAHQLSLGCGRWSAISTTTARWCWSIRRWRSPPRPRPPTPRWCVPSGAGLRRAARA